MNAYHVELIRDRPTTDEDDERLSDRFEGRKNLIEADAVDCMVALPGQLCYPTQIPAGLR